MADQRLISTRSWVDEFPSPAREICEAIEVSAMSRVEALNSNDLIHTYQVSTCSRAREEALYFGLIA